MEASTGWRYTVLSKALEVLKQAGFLVTPQLEAYVLDAEREAEFHKFGVKQLWQCARCKWEHKTFVEASEVTHVCTDGNQRYAQLVWPKA